MLVSQCVTRSSSLAKTIFGGGGGYCISPQKIEKRSGPDLIYLRKKIKYLRHYHHDLILPSAIEGSLLLLQKIAERCFHRYISCSLPRTI